MTQHRFLSADQKVQYAAFGEGARTVAVVVNAGKATFSYESKLGGIVELPPFGFVIESPTFAAFHASRWAGLDYSEPAMFTLRSLDGKPLAGSHRVRAYHAFGDERVRLAAVTRRVRREEILR
jgi:hypothetical protein